MFHFIVMVSLKIIAMHTGTFSHVVTPWIKMFHLRMLKNAWKLVQNFSTSGRVFRLTLPSGLLRGPAGAVGSGCRSCLVFNSRSWIFPNNRHWKKALAINHWGHLGMKKCKEEHGKLLSCETCYSIRLAYVHIGHKCITRSSWPW